MKSKPNPNIDYVYVKNIKHLLRPEEDVFFTIKTNTICSIFSNPVEKLPYYIIATQHRVLIVAKSKFNEYSTAFGYKELGDITILRGLLKDKVKIHHDIYNISKKQSRLLYKLADYLTVKLSVWKYIIYLVIFVALLGAGWRLFLYLGNYNFINGNSYNTVQNNQNTNQGQTSINNQSSSGSQNENTGQSIKENLIDILKAYKYVFKEIQKNYPIYRKRPSLSGAPSLTFDQWVSREVINSLDAQDNKLSSLNITKEKHVMFKLGLSQLKYKIMKYLDYCKKSFKNKKFEKRLPALAFKIKKDMKKLGKIIE